MEAYATPGHTGPQGIARSSCRRCGRTEHLVDGDGPTVCRVCLFAWGHYAAAILRGGVVREAGNAQLHHATHVYPMLGCQLCRAGATRAAPSFDGWPRGQSA